MIGVLPLTKGRTCRFAGCSDAAMSRRWNQCGAAVDAEQVHSEDRPVVAVVGTFDVENFGDVLFPRVIRHELESRHLDWDVRVVAPFGDERPEPAIAFDPSIALPEWGESGLNRLGTLVDAVISGGGEIMHDRDELLAPHYESSPAILSVRRPSWFFAGGAGPSVPLAWNAIGVPFQPEGPFAEHIRASIEGATYVSVRDPDSRDRILRLGVDRDVALVPDVALGMQRVFAPKILEGRREVHRVLGSIPRSPYRVVSGNADLAHHAPAIAQALREMDAEHPLETVVVATSVGHGDRDFYEHLAQAMGVRPRRVPALAGVDDIVAAISGADEYIGVSMHGAITAWVFGLPVVVMNPSAISKLDGIRYWLDEGLSVVHAVVDAPGAMRQVRRASRSLGSLRSVHAALDSHYDALVESLMAPVEARFGRRSSVSPHARMQRMRAELTNAQRRRAGLERRLTVERRRVAAAMATLHDDLSLIHI